MGNFGHYHIKSITREEKGDSHCYYMHCEGTWVRWREGNDFYLTPIGTGKLHLREARTKYANHEIVLTKD